MGEIEKLLVSKRFSLREVLRCIDEGHQGVVLLVDEEGIFIRVITDGDIRRLLINGSSLETTLEGLSQANSKSLSDTASVQDAYHLMQQFEVDHIPFINSEGKPVKLVHRRDLSANILLSTPHIGEQEQHFVREAFKTNWVAPLGPNVDAFEKDVATYVNSKAAVALSSGTAALHLALILLDVKANDYVFCSSFTFVASANVILYQGAKPVFIDSEPDTWNMSPEALKKALEEAKLNASLPKAVIIVNLYGQSAKYRELTKICDAYSVPIIEDAAESLGATYDGKYSGTFGKLGIFSFNGNKIITTSGGGMLVSDEPELIERARFLATQARDPADHYEHSIIGYNYRMSNLLAGVGRGQMQVLEKRIEARQEIYYRYKRALEPYKLFQMMPEISEGRSTHWLSTLTIDPRQTKIKPLDILRYLIQFKIEARRTWKPMHLQPLFAKALYYKHNSNSISDELFDYGICLPSGSNLSSADIDRVIACLLACIKQHERSTELS